jgi:hypothetical protein
MWACDGRWRSAKKKLVDREEGERERERERDRRERERKRGCTR